MKELKLRGLEIVYEHTVPTKRKEWQKHIYPTCYKIDIAIPSQMIAIEVDGASHNGQLARERDAKKNNFLSGLGWTVYRVRNKSIKKNVKEVLPFITLR